MKWRGVAAGLHPARDAAREAARTLLPPMPTGGGAEPKPPPPTGIARAAASVAVGDWLLDQDPITGALVAHHIHTGSVVELAPPEGPRSNKKREIG